jgi:threonine dehydrogenase-like Zn-dependent dehydrogenase
MPGGPEAIQKVRELTGGRGVDVVIDTTGMLPVIAEGRDGALLADTAFDVIPREGATFYSLYFKEIRD